MSLACLKKIARTSESPKSSEPAEKRNSPLLFSLRWTFKKITKLLLKEHGETIRKSKKPYNHRRSLQQPRQDLNTITGRTIKSNPATSVENNASILSICK
jgi:hypothetical protein